MGSKICLASKSIGRMLIFTLAKRSGGNKGLLDPVSSNETFGRAGGILSIITSSGCALALAAVLCGLFGSNRSQPEWATVQSSP